MSLTEITALAFRNESVDMEELEAYVNLPTPKLVRWRAQQPGAETRRLYFDPEVGAQIASHDWALCPGEKWHQMRKRRRELHSLLDAWLQGGPILPLDELKPLKPSFHGVWEFRTLKPPGCRVLGVLPERNVFVGFGLYRRDRIGNDWSVLCTYTRSKWINLLPDVKLLKAEQEALTTRNSKDYWS